jgi:hypothetical protein
VSVMDLTEQNLSNIFSPILAGEMAVVVDSPPGAGKTTLLQAIAARALETHRWRVMVVTNTNSQAVGIIDKICAENPGIAPVFFHRAGHLAARELRHRWGRQIGLAQSARDLPYGPAIVVATAHKWAAMQLKPHFDLQLVEEAYQLPDFRFHQVAAFADRFILVGDPGQIPPIIKGDIERWRGEKSGPHLPAPPALLHRFDQRFAVVKLPVSWRLNLDTVAFVQPAFYPEHPFTAGTRPEQRRLIVEPGSGSGIDLAIDAAANGAGMVMIELPEEITGQADPAAAATIAQTIARLLTRNASILDETSGEKAQRILPGNIGVVCANVTQVTAVRRLLDPAWLRDDSANGGKLLVETADRFQGLQRKIMLVHHPLSGRFEANEFHMNVGRLCVMLSRHEVACFIVSRKGIDRVLRDYVPTGQRLYGAEDDPEFSGWKAHRFLVDQLRRTDRVIPYFPEGAAADDVSPPCRWFAR